MWKRKLCLGTSKGFDLTTDEQIRLFAETGFEGFFTDSLENLKECRQVGDSLGMLYQSIHAPFGNAAKMWRDDCDVAVKELFETLEKCHEVEVDLLVCHTWISFDYDDKPNEVGIEAWEKVISRAKELGVRIALENTEGEEFLDALLNAFSDRDNVGFCLDTGHEMCYNKSRDLLALYGDRLFSTHINDNLGIRDYNGKITWLDDLHLLPFDGIADWEDVAKRLNRCGYDGPLTFELIRRSSFRNQSLKYERLDIREYIAECYARACKFAAFCEKFTLDKSTK